MTRQIQRDNHLEPLRDVPADYDRSEFRLLLRQFDRNLARLNRPFSDKVYTVNGFTQLRTIDCSTATVEDLCHFVGTILYDQYRFGRLQMVFTFDGDADFSGTSSFTATNNFTHDSAAFVGTSSFTASGTVV